MGSLKDWAFQNSTYLKVADGESVTCLFIGWEEFIDHENDDRCKVRYTFDVNGVEKTLESQSVKLAEEMSKVKEGEWMELTRVGAGRSTSWEVKALKGPDDEISEKDLKKADKKIKEKRPF